MVLGEALHTIALHHLATLKDVLVIKRMRKLLFEEARLFGLRGLRVFIEKAQPYSPECNKSGSIAGIGEPGIRRVT